MRAQQLNRQLTLQHQTTGTNAQSEPISVPADEATLWAAIRGPLNGREAERAGVSLAEQPVEIYTRYRTDVTPEKQLTDGTTVYLIRSVVDPDGRRRELRILAVVRS
jgi:SPP1 family predicted phage head-tail adaptor